VVGDRRGAAISGIFVGKARFRILPASTLPLESLTLSLQKPQDRPKPKSILAITHKNLSQTTQFFFRCPNSLNGRRAFTTAISGNFSQTGSGLIFLVLDA
jgi:hypothetical protein